jgi:hypothetical protein
LARTSGFAFDPSSINMRVAGNFQLCAAPAPCVLQIDFSKTEAKPNRGIDRAPIEEAVRQAAIDL